MIITRVFYTIVRIIQNKQTRRFILEGQIIIIIIIIEMGKAGRLDGGGERRVQGFCGET
jgi:hypothetical protein